MRFDLQAICRVSRSVFLRGGTSISFSRCYENSALRSAVVIEGQPQRTSQSLSVFGAAHWRFPNGLIFAALSFALSGQVSAKKEDADQVPERGSATKTTDTHEPHSYDGLKQADEAVSNVHTAKWRVYTDIGRDFYAQGRIDEAEKYFRRAIEEAKEGFGPQDAHVASSYNNLAELFRVQRDFAKAEPLYIEAVNLLKEAYGSEHRSVASALHNLAGVYLMQQKFDTARSYYEQSLHIKEKAFGPHHPEYASTLFHLGEVMRQQGHDEDALLLIRNSLKILEESGTAISKIGVRRMGLLAHILVHTKQLEEAENVQRKMLHAVEMLQGPESISAVAAAEQLGVTLLLRGKLEEAVSTLKRCLDARQLVQGQNHPQVGETLKVLGVAFSKQADALVTAENQVEAAEGYSEAIKLLERSVGIAEPRWKQDLASFQAAQAVPGSLSGGHRPNGPLQPSERSLAIVERLMLLATALQRLSQLSVISEDMRQNFRSAAERHFTRILQILDEPSLPENLFSKAVSEKRRALEMLKRIQSSQE